MYQCTMRFSDPSQPIRAIICASLPHVLGWEVCVCTTSSLAVVAQAQSESIEVYVGSVGHGVQWDTVTEYHVVPGTSRNVQVHYHS